MFSNATVNDAVRESMYDRFHVVEFYLKTLDDINNALSIIMYYYTANPMFTKSMVVNYNDTKFVFIKDNLNIMCEVSSNSNPIKNYTITKTLKTLLNSKLTEVSKSYSIAKKKLWNEKNYDSIVDMYKKEHELDSVIEYKKLNLSTMMNKYETNKFDNTGKEVLSMISTKNTDTSSIENDIVKLFEEELTKNANELSVEVKEEEPTIVNEEEKTTSVEE